MDDFTAFKILEDESGGELNPYQRICARLLDLTVLGLKNGQDKNGHAYNWIFHDPPYYFFVVACEAVNHTPEVIREKVQKMLNANQRAA